MSTATDLQAAPQAPELDHDSRCAACGAPLQTDQEWCLECGAARTIIHRPPDWRIPLAVVGGVVVLALVAFAIALINLSSDANRSGRAHASPSPQAGTQADTATAARSTATAKTGTTAAALAPIPKWPSGVSGWTIVLAQRHKHAKAVRIARRLEQQGLAVGVLSSSKHPIMTPGYFVVFLGRYPDQASAETAAAKLRAQGHPHAQAREVVPPGGV